MKEDQIGGPPIESGTMGVESTVEMPFEMEMLAENGALLDELEEDQDVIWVCTFDASQFSSLAVDGAEKYAEPEACAPSMPEKRCVSASIQISKKIGRCTLIIFLEIFDPK